jgi:5-formyltetrahydrofolate cyclo-ligase
VLRVGVALDSEIIEEVPAEAHDEPVDVVVTPTRTIRIDGG